MRPTRFGVQAGVFYLAMVAAFYAAPYSNLYFLLLGFLTLVLLAGALGARRNLRGVRAEVGALPPVPAGSSATLPVGLRAPGRGRFQVEVRLALEGGAELVGVAGVVDREARADVAVAALPRGLHRVTGAWVETTYPFGLFRARLPVEAPDELVVYPAPSDLSVGRGAAGALEELTGGDGRGDLQPAELRDHREGEGLHGVHWRASARRGKLVVQEWEGGSGGDGLEVVLDRRAEPDELERALEILSAIVRYAREEKEPLRLKSQDLAATFGPAHRPWAEALRFLAAAVALPADAAAPPAAGARALRLPRGRAAA